MENASRIPTMAEVAGRHDRRHGSCLHFRRFLSGRRLIIADRVCLEEDLACLQPESRR